LRMRTILPRAHTTSNSAKCSAPAILQRVLANCTSAS
jgi:hypothetical protein